MKHPTKFLALLLAFALAFTLAAPAMAAEAETQIELTAQAVDGGAVLEALNEAASLVDFVPRLLEYLFGVILMCIWSVLFLIPGVVPLLSIFISFAFSWGSIPLALIFWPFFYVFLRISVIFYPLLAFLGFLNLFS